VISATTVATLPHSDWTKQSKVNARERRPMVNGNRYFVANHID
jgi:hypothetical protein